jgi:uncharacterized protein
VTENKTTVEKYIDGFRKSDHEQILSCLTDDVEWDIPGMFHAVGKEAFDKEIENEAFVGSPTLVSLSGRNSSGEVGGTLRAARCRIEPRPLR